MCLDSTNMNMIDKTMLSEDLHNFWSNLLGKQALPKTPLQIVDGLSSFFELVHKISLPLFFLTDNKTASTSPSLCQVLGQADISRDVQISTVKHPSQWNLWCPPVFPWCRLQKISLFTILTFIHMSFPRNSAVDISHTFKSTKYFSSLFHNNLFLPWIQCILTVKGVYDSVSNSAALQNILNWIHHFNTVLLDQSNCQLFSTWVLVPSVD